MRNIEHRLAANGPGGYKCECCDSQIGTNLRKKRRRTKKRVRRLFRDLIQRELIDKDSGML